MRMVAGKTHTLKVATTAKLRGWAALEISDWVPHEMMVTTGMRNHQNVSNTWRFSHEFMDELCREVTESSNLVKSGAIEYGVGTERVPNWLKKFRQAHGTLEAELNVYERSLLRKFKRENLVGSG